MFAYCNNRPILFFDSTGTIIELAADATEEEKEQYARAVAYLKSSRTGAALIQKLEESDIVFIIIFIDNDDMCFDPNTKQIYFDAYSGLILGDGISVQSAAIGLAHEMGHAADSIDGVNYALSSLERENNIIEKYETPIASELGEPIRSNYYDEYGCRRMNNSTHHVIVRDLARPFWHYILFWKLFSRYCEVIEQND